MQLDLASTNSFFTTFFQLPDRYWRGFLASSLSSQQLVIFALLTFVQAPLHIKVALMRHILSDPAGAYLVRYYLSKSPTLCAKSMNLHRFPLFPSLSHTCRSLAECRFSI